MENNRSSWGSNLGFLMAAIGSAVGLGNIWGFPYKMGRSGGFTFLIAYLLLAVFVGFVIASTRQTGGSLRAISPYYRPASKGAGFHFVQALLSLPLLLAPPRGYFTL